MSIIIQSNPQMGFGTILSNLYECIIISQRLKDYHRTLYVNCSITFYFNSSMFFQIFSKEYLLTQFNDVIVSDSPYSGDIPYAYTRDSSQHGKVNWDIFTSNDELKKYYNHKFGLPNKFSLRSDILSIDGGFNIFSQNILSKYKKLDKPYVAISFRGKNMTDSEYVIDNYMESFQEIINTNELVYVCGTSSILKNKLTNPKTFYNEMYINEEDFEPNVYDDEKLKQMELLCLDMLYLNDCSKIYHYTYFKQISFFLIIPFINNVPIEIRPVNYSLG